METKETSDLGGELIIPFIHRKNLLLSISFRSPDLETNNYKMKVEPIENAEHKESIITQVCELTMVI
jgi:hypothetical protein